MKRLLCIAVLSCGIGCRSNPSISPYAEHSDLQRETSRAEALSREAADLIYTDPVKAEHDLNALVPPDEWGALSLRLILHGRKVCAARKPRCDECVLADVCPSAFKV